MTRIPKKNTGLIRSVNAVAEIVIETVSGEHFGPVLALNHLRSKVVIICKP